MKRLFILLIFQAALCNCLLGQDVNNQGARILFHGLVMDGQSETPLSNTQIFINRLFSSVSDENGKFAFYAIKRDTVVFRLLGYKPAFFHISDTLAGKEFVTGVYMHADTVAIDEVVIIPRLANLKSDMFSPRSDAARQTQNANNNLALSAYQARMGQNKLGDPAINYEVIRQRQKNEAFTKGQIPSDRIVGLSPLMLIPAAYMLLHGLPEKPPSLQPRLTDQEVREIHKRYMESIRKKE
jgi:hypothetical protein